MPVLIFLFFVFLSPVQAFAGQLEDGRAAFDRQDFPTALKLMQPLADQGNAEAQYEIGLMYENGWSVDQDFSIARKWLSKGAENGFSWAQYHLGAMYEYGIGVDQDYKLAGYWSRKANAPGNSLSQYKFIEPPVFNYPHKAIKTIAETADSSAAPPPTGFKIYSSQIPDKDQLYCSRYDKEEWAVSQENGQINIVKWNRDISGWIKTLPFRGGILKAEDAGEFGGALWWSKVDGSNKTRLLGFNTRGFIETSFGILALTGLSHMGTDIGGVYLFSDQGPSPPKAGASIGDLGGAPDAYTKDTSGNVIIATRNNILRIGPPQKMETLINVNYKDLFPNSIVITSSGIIYVGLGHFITRLTPQGDKYREDWLVSTSCPKFQMKNYQCYCAKE